MSVQELSQLIGSVGFPIVASCGMFWLYNKTVTDITSTLRLMDTTLRDICHIIGTDPDKDGKED